jgi:hypothetical protein
MHCAFQTFEGLPVLQLDSFDTLTPALLEAAYAPMLQRRYEWDKLTPKWWVQLVLDMARNASAAYSAHGAGL